MSTYLSHVPHVRRDDGQRVFDLRIDMAGRGTGYLFGIPESEQDGITDAFLSSGYAAFDHIGQVLGDVDPVHTDRSVQWLIREGSDDE